MTKQEFEKKFMQNYKVDGFGLDVAIHMPCPFCAEAGFLIYKILEMREKLIEGAECKSCGRAMKGIFTEIAGGERMEMVQTKGDAPPDYTGIRKI